MLLLDSCYSIPGMISDKLIDMINRYDIPYVNQYYIILNTISYSIWSLVFDTGCVALGGGDERPGGGRAGRGEPTDFSAGRAVRKFK